MQDLQNRLIAQHAAAEDKGVLHFASHVVALLAARNSQPESLLREDLVHLLVNAVTSDNSDRLRDLLRELKRQKITAEALADRYIPEAARAMGAAWSDDRLGFMEVSMGSARLQGLLREIGAAWVADHCETEDNGALLLIVPKAEQHTLGAMVLLGQLRRMGVSVCIRFAPTEEELHSLLRPGRFNGVLVSVASAEKLDVSRRLVKSIRKTGPQGLPVVLGGPVLEIAGEAEAATGADLATNDLVAALQACGLASSAKGVRKRA
ncbi:cobalamin-dependent protein [Paracoccaceae bacterium Fryx2]|nr:cobalamin-dependent protein [Paracoccaceae bacterium Fryx2]